MSDDLVIDDGMLCHCELSGEFHVVTSKTCCEVCTVSNLLPLTAENVRKVLLLVNKTLEMRHAIDMIEGALMGLGDFVELPEVFDGSRDDLILALKVKLGEVRRVCAALAECTRIINSEEYDPKIFN